MRSFVRHHALAALLGFVPVAGALAIFAPDSHRAIFITSAVAILPLAGYMGRATSALAERLGSGIGGLLNATFGNAAELIIAALALHAGLPNLVKASLTGSIIGNVLLVFGASALAGGIGRHTQRFNRTAATVGTTMLLLSAIGLVVPAVFHWLSRAIPDAPELRLDTEISVVLFVTYCLSLVFTLKTHRQLYGQHATSTRNASGERDSIWWPLGILLAATVATAYMSELLVDSVTVAARGLGMSELFVGVIVVALVGNAAEHYSAVQFAWHDDMDAALAIAVGSSTQVALFVAPTLVFLSYVIAPQPMDLLFTVFEVVAIVLSMLIIGFISHDGETHWLEGVQLLAVYIILALGFFFLPGQLSK